MFSAEPRCILVPPDVPYSLLMFPTGPRHNPTESRHISGASSPSLWYPDFPLPFSNMPYAFLTNPIPLWFPKHTIALVASLLPVHLRISFPSSGTVNSLPLGTSILPYPFYQFYNTTTTTNIGHNHHHHHLTTCIVDMTTTHCSTPLPVTTMTTTMWPPPTTPPYHLHWQQDDDNMTPMANAMATRQWWQWQQGQQ